MGVASFGRNPIDSLQTALRTGAARANDAIGSAQNGVNAVLGAGAKVQAAVAELQMKGGR